MGTNKTKAEIQSELQRAHQRIAELEAAAAEHAQERHTSDSLYRALIASRNVALCRWRPDTTLTFANQGYRQMFGTAEELVGRQWLTFLPEAKRSEAAAF
ncbi:MAG: PAS domain S-box protein, partial [Anaerolineales bacterium]|nr:PAS domain S-box protein [Anaerolineales bacterium]